MLFIFVFSNFLLHHRRHWLSMCCLTGLTFAGALNIDHPEWFDVNILPGSLQHHNSLGCGVANPYMSSSCYMNLKGLYDIKVVKCVLGHFKLLLIPTHQRNNNCVVILLPKDLVNTGRVVNRIFWPCFVHQLLYMKCIQHSLMSDQLILRKNLCWITHVALQTKGNAFFFFFWWKLMSTIYVSLCYWYTLLTVLMNGEHWIKIILLFTLFCSLILNGKTDKSNILW